MQNLCGICRFPRIMEVYNEEDLLILVKTYPSPSAKYRETTCVAAVNREGKMRRIFPVPFRLLSGDSQFNKWEWIKARLAVPTSDHRPEKSPDRRRFSIVRSGNFIKTAKGDWGERLERIEPHVLPSFPALEERRQVSGETLGAIRPTELLELEIKASRERDWTEADRCKLIQDGLFDSPAVRNRPPLRKLPHDFYYHYLCETPTGVQKFRHKLVDWEAGALYWQCQQRYGSSWEEKFRQKLEVEFAQKDLIFLMGTIHRFPSQWLIIGVIYPPKQKPALVQQLALL